MTDCNFLINLFDLKNVKCCMSCHEDYEDYDMAIHEFYHPDYDDGYQALRVCCDLSDFCKNLTEEQWKLIIEKKHWRKKSETESLKKIFKEPSPIIYPASLNFIKKDTTPKKVKSKYYFMKQFQNEFNSGKENMSIGSNVFKFGHDLYTGAGNILAAKDFWHLLFTNKGEWKLFTILFLKKQKSLRLLKQELIKNFNFGVKILITKKSFLKRIFDMIFGIKKIKNIKNKGILYQVIL